jgi:hypothetical protein
MSAQATCNRCGAEKPSSELHQTHQGQLCQSCVADRKNVTSGDTWLTTKTILIGIGVILFAGAMTVGGWLWSKRQYNVAVERQYRACLSEGYSKTSERPKRCDQIFEKHAWLAHVPTISEEYRNAFAEARAKSVARRLTYYSHAAPDRDKTLDLLRSAQTSFDDSVAQLRESIGPIRSLLWGELSEDAVGTYAEFARLILQPPDNASQIRQLLSVATRTEFDAIRSISIDRTLTFIDQTERRGCQDACEPMLNIATMACRNDWPNAGNDILEEYKRAVQETAASTAEPWETLSTSTKRTHRKAFNIDTISKINVATLLEKACADDPEDSQTDDHQEVSWWTSKSMRKSLRHQLRADDTRVNLAAIAHRLESGRDDASGLHALLTEGLDEASVPSNAKGETPVIDILDRLIAVSEQTDLRGFFTFRPLVPVKVLDAAIQKLPSESSGNFGSKKTTKLRDALLVERALTTARIGEISETRHTLQTLRDKRVDIQYDEFRAILALIYGQPELAADVRHGASNPRAIMFRTLAEGASGDMEWARKSLEKLTKSEVRRLAEGNLLSTYVAAGHLLSFFSKDRPETSPSDLLHTELKIEERIAGPNFNELLTNWNKVEKYREARRSKQRSMRMARIGARTNSTWDELGVAGVISNARAESLYLDRIALDRNMPAAFDLWQRVQIGQWTGRSDVADAWKSRLFPDRKQLDEPGELLLAAIR